MLKKMLASQNLPNNDKFIRSPNYIPIPPKVAYFILHKKKKQLSKTNIGELKNLKNGTHVTVHKKISYISFLRI